MASEVEVKQRERSEGSSELPANWFWFCEAVLFMHGGVASGLFPKKGCDVSEGVRFPHFFQVRYKCRDNGKDGHISKKRKDKILLDWKKWCPLPPLKDSYITPLPQHTHTLNQDWEFIVNDKLLMLVGVYVCRSLRWTEYKGVCEWRRGGGRGEERKVKK